MCHISCVKFTEWSVSNEISCNQIFFKMKHSDVTIEPEIYSNIYERKLWVKRHSEFEHNLETRKKYIF